MQIGTQYGQWLSGLLTGVYNPFGIGDIQGTFIAELNWDGTKIATTFNPSVYGTGTVELTCVGSRIVRRYSTAYVPPDTEMLLSDTSQEPITYWEADYTGRFYGSAGTWLTGITVWPDPNGTSWDSKPWWIFEQNTYCTGTIDFLLKFYFWDPMLQDVAATRFNISYWRTLSESLRTTYTHHILYGVDYALFKPAGMLDSYIGSIFKQEQAGTIATIVFSLTDEPEGEIESIIFSVATIVNTATSSGNPVTLTKGVDAPFEGDWPNKINWVGTLYLHSKEWPQSAGSFGTIYGTQRDTRRTE